MKIYILFTFAIGLLSLAACAPLETPDPGDPWVYTDLRALSAADAGEPDLDLVALYTRNARTDFQVRLDLFDLKWETQAEIYVALDTHSGGTRQLPFAAQAALDWDILLAIPPNGLPRAYSAVELPAGQTGDSFPSFEELPGLIPRAVRLPWLDSVIIAANASSLSHGPGAISLEVFALRPGDSMPVDHIGPVRSDGMAPGRAPVLLAFWNTFPAYTPAQALRRWDGAHTGPFGERHGLHVLLQNVRRYRVPVVLLDLKNPAWLSALDTVGGLPLVQEMARRSLLVLPDAIYASPGFPYFPDGLPSWAIDQAIQDSQAASSQFGLPATRILYAPRWNERLPEIYPLIFTEGAPGAGRSWRAPRLLPVPLSSADLQTNDEGLTLEVRRQLLDNAIAAGKGESPEHLVLLGGSLPDSAFGDPQASEAAFIYLAGHPWMMPVGEAWLASFPRDLVVDLPASPPFPSWPATMAPYAAILSTIPRPGTTESLEVAEWEAALSLYAPLPPESEQLQPLRAHYSAQVGGLDIARQWAAAPQFIRECLADLDLDDLPECVLASPDVYASFDLIGGRLKRVFVRNSSGVHQLVGPSSQFIVGLGDPSTYDLTAGDAADPAMITGGLVDAPPPWPLYRATFELDGLQISSPDGNVTKTFRLKPDGLSIEYHAAEPRVLEIPLALDPWQRGAPGWAERYQLRSINGGWSWGLLDGPAVTVLASSPTVVYPFNASLPGLRRFENPNLDYPRGHYLPYPMALLAIESPGDFSLEISLAD